MPPSCTMHHALGGDEDTSVLSILPICRLKGKFCCPSNNLVNSVDFHRGSSRFLLFPLSPAIGHSHTHEGEVCA